MPVYWEVHLVNRLGMYAETYDAIMAFAKAWLGQVQNRDQQGAPRYFHNDTREGNRGNEKKKNNEKWEIFQYQVGKRSGMKFNTRTLRGFRIHGKGHHSDRTHHWYLPIEEILALSSKSVLFFCLRAAIGVRLDVELGLADQRMPPFSRCQWLRRSWPCQSSSAR